MQLGRGLEAVQAWPGSAGICRRRRATASLDRLSTRGPTAASMGRDEETRLQGDQRNWTTRAAGCDPSRQLGVESASRKTLDRSGRLIGQQACPQTLTSWDRVFRMLRDQFPAEHYHVGKDLRSIGDGAEEIVAHFADGGEARGDLIVGADGFRAMVRGAVLPQVRPLYAGYVAWRGLVEERLLSARTHADIFDAMVFGLPPGEQFISYPIAGPDNDLRPGHRRCNFVWYRGAE